MASHRTILLALANLAIPFIGAKVPSDASILAIKSPIRYDLPTTESIFTPTSPPESTPSLPWGFPSSLAALELPSASLPSAAKRQKTCAELKLPAPTQSSRVDWE